MRMENERKVKWNVRMAINDSVKIILYGDAPIKVDYVYTEF